MTRERAGGQRYDTCTWTFKASGKTSWRLSKWNFAMSVVFNTWRAYALPLFLSLIALNMPCGFCGLALLLAAWWGWSCPGGAGSGDVALVAATRKGTSWLLGWGGLSSLGAAGRYVLAPTGMRPCPTGVLLNALTPACHIHTVGCKVCNSLGVCLQRSFMVRSLMEL